VCFLLLLKSGRATTQEKAGARFGWKKRQSQKIWQLYRSGTTNEVLRKSERWNFGKLSSNAKKEAAVGAEYKKTLARLPSEYAEEDVEFEDEMRVGTRTALGKKFTPSGMLM